MKQNRLLWHSPSLRLFWCLGAACCVTFCSWWIVRGSHTILTFTLAKPPHPYICSCYGNHGWFPCTLVLQQMACCIDTNMNKSRCLFNWFTASVRSILAEIRLKDLACYICKFSCTSEAAKATIHLAHRVQLIYIGIPYLAQIDCKRTFLWAVVISYYWKLINKA